MISENYRESQELHSRKLQADKNTRAPLYTQEICILGWRNDQNFIDTDRKACY